MTFSSVSVEDAIERGGLRMVVVVGGTMNPWVEAAKGIPTHFSMRSSLRLHLLRSYETVAK